MFYMNFTYLLFALPGMLLAAWAQYKVTSAYRRASQIPCMQGFTGAQAANHMLQANGVNGLGIEPIAGEMTDHYDPQSKTLRLSEGVYGSTSLAAVGIAAHEAGHALQDAQRYPLLVTRGALVPVANLAGNLSWLIILAGMVLLAAGAILGKVVLLAGVGLFSVTVLFQLVNLPVEFDASRRARVALVEQGIVSTEEDQEVKKVLDAAALTYLAGTLTGILTLVYYLYEAGLLGGRDE
ncbi:MAG: zinc metallopeptidase [Gemmataceae bacterium]